MQVHSNALLIEGHKRCSIPSFCSFLSRRLLECIEENGGDFTALDNYGSDWVLMIIGEYEDGAR
jgi:hypothetical protein